MSSNEPNDPLERFIDRTLHDLPLRRAPPALLSRVLAVTGQRAASAWWRRAFDSWPVAAQGGFIVVAIVFATLAVYVLHWMPLQLDLHGHFGTSSIAAVLKALVTLHSSVAGRLPLAWVYGVVAVIAAIYATGLGIGAIAYRTLYASR